MKLRIGMMFLVVGLLAGGDVSAVPYRQISGVIHLHSSYSSGQYSLQELVDKARQKKIGILIPTDHDLVVMEYGLFPLRNLIKRREERPSIIKLGPEVYLAEIKRLNQAQDDVMILPGVQSSPFYYWTGSPLKKNLTAHDYRKELLLIGMQTPEDYLRLPLLHNGFSTRYALQRLPQAIVFFLAFGIGLVLVIQKGRLRAIGVTIAIISLLLLVDQHPFKSSPYDPYSGSKGVAPYQETIDYVRQRDGLVFWAHPESRYAAEGVSLGPVTLKTRPYPDDLAAARNYTGFSAVYGDTTTAAEPGRHWDQLLMQYCRTERDRPAWAIAGADFHVEKKGVQLDTFQTVFCVQKKTIVAVMDALARGRVYAVRKGTGPRLVLKNFRVKDTANGTAARMGEEISVAGPPMVEGVISVQNGGRYPVEVTLIRGGKIWQQFEGPTPLSFEFVDRGKALHKTYYRVVVKGRGIGKLLSNPIFAVNK